MWTGNPLQYFGNFIKNLIWSLFSVSLPPPLRPPYGSTCTAKRRRHIRIHKPQTIPQVACRARCYSRPWAVGFAFYTVPAVYFCGEVCRSCCPSNTPVIPAFVNCWCRCWMMSMANVAWVIWQRTFCLCRIDQFRNRDGKNMVGKPGRLLVMLFTQDKIKNYLLEHGNIFLLIKQRWNAPRVKKVVVE